MKYKIIASDFDGTLLSSNKKLSTENIEALKKCKAMGCMIVGITARNLSSVKSVCQIDLFDYFIINNGTYIYDVTKNKGEYINYLNRDIVEDITDKFLDKSAGIDYCTVDKYYSNKTEIKNLRPFHIRINSLDEISNPIARVNIFARFSEDIDAYKKYIKEKYSNLNCITMQDTDIDINKKWVVVNPEGCSKATGLGKLLKKIGCSMDEVLYFGDSTNDIEIIRAVGCGIAMENAINDVKDIANDITTTNDENGVAEYINKLLD